MPLQPQLRLALDTNGLFDRADGQDFAIATLEFLHGRGIALAVTHAVLAELDSAVTRPLSPRNAHMAEHVLDNLCSWRIEPVALTDADRGIAAEFSIALRRAQLLPAEEIHDGCILAEAALARAQFLVNSDHHLLSRDPGEDKAHLSSPRTRRSASRLGRD